MPKLPSLGLVQGVGILTRALFPFILSSPNTIYVVQGVIGGVGRPYGQKVGDEGSVD